MTAKPELARSGSHRHAAASPPKQAKHGRHGARYFLTTIAGVAVAGAIIGAMALVPGKSTDQASADAMSQSPAKSRMIGRTTPEFAGTTVTAYLTSYDHRTLRFRTATWVSGGLDGGHFAIDRKTHSLKLAAAPRIHSAVALCSHGQITLDAKTGAPTKACTSTEMAAGLSTGTGAYADLEVNASGQVTTVTERYVP